MAEGFLLKRWTVNAGYYGSAVIIAATRGKALAEAFGAPVFAGVSFREYLRIVTCRRDRDDPPRWGDPITFQGLPAFFIDCDGAHIRFAYAGGDRVCIAHPYDVLPVEYRPPAYRDRAAA